MELTIIIVMCCIILVCLVVGIILIARQSKPIETKDNYELASKIAKQFQDLQNGLNESIVKSFKVTDEKISEFNKQIALLEKGQENLNNLSNNILSLEKILGNNKETGNFGEALLEQILMAYFGEDHKLYDVQHSLDNGTKPDAVIYMPHETICIDSKFPVQFYKEYLSEECLDKDSALKNLSNEAKKQIKEISSKYIVEGITPGYAVMFVPSDSLLQLIHSKLNDILEFANSSQVILLSPSTLVPFISSLKIVKIDYEKNEKASELYNKLKELAVEFERFNERYQKLSKQIIDISKQEEDLSITTSKITNKFNKIKNMDFNDEE